MDASLNLCSNTDRTARLSYTRMADLLASACERTTRNMSQADWGRFFGPLEPYRCTCPDLPPGVGASTNACEGSD